MKFQLFLSMLLLAVLAHAEKPADDKQQQMNAIEAMFAKVGLEVDPKKTPQQLRVQYINARRRLNETNSTSGGDNGADNGADNAGDNGADNGADNAGDNGSDATDTTGGDNGADNGADNAGDNGSDASDGSGGSTDGSGGDGGDGGDASDNGADSSSAVVGLTTALGVALASLVMA